MAGLALHNMKDATAMLGSSPAASWNTVKVL